jgi:hypothetical protein
MLAAGSEAEPHEILPLPCPPSPRLRSSPDTNQLSMPALLLLNWHPLLPTIEASAKRDAMISALWDEGEAGQLDRNRTAARFTVERGVWVGSVPVPAEWLTSTAIAAIFKNATQLPVFQGPANYIAGLCFLYLSRVLAPSKSVYKRFRHTSISPFRMVE